MNPSTDTYLLPLGGINWPEALASWAFLLPRRFSLLFANRFGDVFIVQEDGSVHMLNLATGTLDRLADKIEDLADLLEVDVLRQNWLMTNLVDQCIEAGLLLKPGEVYSYKVPPSLGGTMELDNVEIMPAADHYHAMAEIQLMLDELPPDASP